jgi:hypothetical protein
MRVCLTLLRRFAQSGSVVVEGLETHEVPLPFAAAGAEADRVEALLGHLLSGVPGYSWRSTDGVIVVPRAANKQLERTVMRRHVRAASASFHFAPTARWIAQRAAAELRRLGGSCRPLRDLQ